MNAPVRRKLYRALFPYCGAGGGPLGFKEASASVERFGLEGGFEIMGGIDIDEAGARDFEMFTGVPCMVADMRDVTPEALREYCGHQVPDVVFSSPPCKGASGLLGNDKAETETYQEMNKLLLVWVDLMLATWAGDLPPLLIFENVPRITSRAKGVLAEAITKLKKAGYVLHAGTHNCGELGGLAQNRERFLMVCRLERKVPNLLYQPPRQRVRGCGEVLGTLPLPSDPAGGPMHALPEICTLNWIRLALIPPGGDWRDIDGALAADEKRRERWGRYNVAVWAEATPSVVGAGTNGAWGVAEPRVGAEYFPQTFGVVSWIDALGTITGRASVTTGAFSVADVRVPYAFDRGYAVLGWGDASNTIAGKAFVGCGTYAVADPRVSDAFDGAYGVLDWRAPSRTVTSFEGPSTGTCAVADPRFDLGINGHTNILAVGRWSSPARSITGATRPSSGALSVADPSIQSEPRENSGAYGVLRWSGASYTVTGSACFDNGRFAVADPRPLEVVRVEAIATPAKKARRRRRNEPPRRGVPHGRPLRVGVREEWVNDPTPGLVLAADPRVPGGPALAVRFRVTRFDAAPLYVPVFATIDGTWHRPLTTYELLALQSFPTHINGIPVVLYGTNTTDWRERIGNAVPPAAARAVATQMLLTLMHASVGSFVLAPVGSGGAWVRGRSAPMWLRKLGVFSLYPERSKSAARRCGTVAPLESGDPWVRSLEATLCEGRA